MVANRSHNTAVVPPRPAAVPPRPSAPPVAGTAAIPAAVNTAPPVAAPPAAVAPVAAPPVTQPAAAETPKTHGKRGGRRANTARTLYHGTVVYGPDNQPVLDTVGEGATAAQVVRRQKLTALPTDYDGVKHEKLLPGDFSTESLYYEFRAAEAAKLVTKFTGMANRLKALGNISDQKSASKLLAMRDKMAELAAQLGPEAVAMLLGENKTAA